MIPAHLVFADINGHSSMPLERRVKALSDFWNICEQHKPRLRSPGTSFYETDNDSLMAGFSGVEEMSLGSDVISWTLRLHQALSTQGVSASFGIGLATSPYTDEWKAIPGFLPDLRSHLYFPDELLTREGGIDRRRLTGNPLIITARLLTLAKKARATIAFSFFQDAPPWDGISHLQAALTSAALPSVFPMDEQLKLLGPEQEEWMRNHEVQPHGIIDTRTALVPFRAFVRPNGWTRCPHCGKGFSTKYKSSWDGYRHTTCGTYLALAPEENTQQ